MGIRNRAKHRAEPAAGTADRKVGGTTGDLGRPARVVAEKARARAKRAADEAVARVTATSLGG
jgi:hypothetical protein